MAWRTALELRRERRRIWLRIRLCELIRFFIGGFTPVDNFAGMPCILIVFVVEDDSDPDRVSSSFEQYFGTSIKGVV